MRALTMFAVIAGALAFAASAAQGGQDTTVVWHDPWLNWDFINNLGFVVNDFAVIVDKANWVPQQQWAVPFPNFQTFAYDWDGDGIFDDTMCKWMGANVPPNTVAHGGLYMLGSGLVLDAFWTLNCSKVGPSTAITYERTKIIGDPEVHMELMIAPGFYEDSLNAGKEAGWTHMRTFVNIPADLLDLPNLNSSLDLGALAAYEVFPKVGGPTGAPIGYDDIIWGVPDSFFDVFLDQIEPEYAGPGYEALLHADVVTAASDPIVVGGFWNLNPQSPEPATIALLGFGAVGLLARRRRK